ncbi:M4 family metallopeptidase [Kitasatospora sp. NBC_01560]|uniref:M4 family metallopeptidase n=1 Tax=Kitasatospora sp. NBC_01560 TaxID=2975965 RepID=UPI0038696ED3
MHHRSRPTAKVLGAGAALSLALALTLASSPALAAPPGPPGPTADPDPVPGLVAGEGTAAPQLVTGLSAAAPGTPGDAARAHLAADPDRYRIDPGQLTELAVERTAEGRHTVRFQQYHGGVPVLGGQYLVRLTGEGAGQRVESVGGKYFTGLTAPTTPAVPAATLRRLALDSLTDPRARAGATAEDRGPVILPGGAGRLAQHFTVRADGPAAGGPLVREVYVDATRGAVALAHDAQGLFQAEGVGAEGASVGTAGAPGAAAAGAGAAHAATAAATAGSTAATAGEPATGTAPDYLGRTVPVNIARQPDGSYRLVDLSRPVTVSTYDGAGRDYREYGRLPADALPAGSPGPDFPASTGTSGATDAHVNAGTVYDFYRNRLGRDGLDGKGSPITSVVNVSNGGAPFPNATWDGQKMIYGNGDAEHRQFAVALDVAGHEMTHGVIQHTANLEYAGQSGAMNEALADYFGNAIDVTAHGVAMTDPKAALLGETLCRTGTPEECANRRLDDRRTTVDDYLGAGLELDGGGVHLNSTIFSGALWDLRRTLDPLTADRLVYRALTEYLTPLDDFVDGRNAVLAAGRSMNLGRAELRSVAGAFDAHGIRAGWQNRIDTDSRTLLRGASAPTGPAAGGGHWVMGSNEDANGQGGIALYTGSTTGSGAPTRLSPADGRMHGWSATDGRAAVWLAIGPDATGAWGTEVLTRPLAGGEVRSLFKSSSVSPVSVRISGGDIAFVVLDGATGRNRVQLSHNGAPPVELPLPEGHTIAPDAVSYLALKDGLLGWIETWTAGGATVQAPTVHSIATGKVVAQYPTSTPQGTAAPFLSSPVLAGGRLLWTAAAADRTGGVTVRSGALDGSGAVDLVPGDAPRTPDDMEITATDRAVTFQHRGARPSTGWTNAALPKLYQLPVTGGTPARVSCNRGTQSHPAADQGTRVVWLDATPGRGDLVVRNRPAGAC